MKPKLLPLEVPWQISPSSPFLSLRVTDYKEREILFGADFRTTAGDYYTGTVRVTFTRALWFRVNPSFEEGIVIQKENYDWSEVEFYDLGNMSIEDWLDRFLKVWTTTGICPYPRAYRVENSDWLSTLPLPEPDYMHLLFVGEELSVEVVARDWAWEQLSRVDQS